MTAMPACRIPALGLSLYLGSTQILRVTSDDGLQMISVPGDLGRVRQSEADPLKEKRGKGIGEPVKHITSVLAAVHQSCVLKDAHVAGHGGHGNAQHFRQLAHAQFGMFHQGGHDAQPVAVGQGFGHRYGRFHGIPLKNACLAK